MRLNPSRRTAILARTSSWGRLPAVADQLRTFGRCPSTTRRIDRAWSGWPRSLTKPAAASSAEILRSDRRSPVSGRCAVPGAWPLTRHRDGYRREACGPRICRARCGCAREEKKEKAPPPVDTSTLSMSAQEKLEAAVRQDKRRLPNMSTPS